ncbi:hypothetical protein, partial [Yersinia pestis]
VNVGHKNCVNYSTAIEPFFVHNGDHKKERKSEKSLFSGEYPAQKTTFSCFHRSPSRGLNASGKLPDCI